MCAQANRARGMELTQNLAFHRREWRFQRIGTRALGLFVLAALAGLFGDGPVSRASATSPDRSVDVRYERFVRRGARSEIRISVSPRITLLSIDSQYLEGLTIEEVVPANAQTEHTTERLTIHLPPRRAEGLSTVVLGVKPSRAGVLHGRIGSDNGPVVEFWQLSYF
jgi:hypothetical protein